MKPLVLNSFEPLFKDFKSFEKFSEVLINCIKENDLSPIVYNEEVIGSILSIEDTKDFFYERLAKKAINLSNVATNIIVKKLI